MHAATRLVIAAQQLGQLLVVVEDAVGDRVLTNHRVGPQLAHEEHLVRQIRIGHLLAAGLGLFQPLRQMAHKVEEKVALGHTDDLVRNLDKQREALHRLESQTLSDRLAEVLGARARVDLKGLVAVVRKVHLRRVKCAHINRARQALW